MSKVTSAGCPDSTGSPAQQREGPPGTLSQVSVLAPASIGNVGPGFDVLGLAIDGLGDRVLARRTDCPGVELLKISGTDLPLSNDNTACVAARLVLEKLGVSWGLQLELEKGLPVGSGLGSSGASAAAAAYAANYLAGNPLDGRILLDACAEAEAAACGAAHRDNVAASLFGGFVLVRADGSYTKIDTDLKLAIALLTPAESLATRTARAAIPTELPRDETVANAAALATLVYAVAVNDSRLIRGAIVDQIAEPRRAHLIPGFLQTKEAALEAGALGASISGAGPTIFALCASMGDASVVSQAMARRYAALGLGYRRHVGCVAWRGTHRVG